MFKDLVSPLRGALLTTERKEGYWNALGDVEDGF